MRKYQTIPHVAYGHTSTLAMTAMERAHGRYLRASAPPTDAGGGGQGGGTGTQGSGADNGGGNNGQQSGSGESGGNNGGNGFDMGSFWNPSGSGAGDPPANQQGSDGNRGSGSGTGNGGGNENADFGRNLGQQLDTMTFGNHVMTPEIAGQIADGNFDGFNTAMEAHSRQVARQALQMSLSVMQRFGDQIFTEMNRRMSGTMTDAENTRALHEAIPLAKEPGMAPVVNSIYSQALRLNQGDRTKAIQMTKDMLKGMHSKVEGDESLGIAPRDSNGGGAPSVNVNWIDELTSR